jgi:hypothetical protein
MIFAMQEWLWLAVTAALTVVGVITFFALRKARIAESARVRQSHKIRREWRHGIKR